MPSHFRNFDMVSCDFITRNQRKRYEIKALLAITDKYGIPISQWT